MTCRWGRCPPTTGQQCVVGGGLDDLDQPVGAALSGGAGVVGVGRDQERFQGCGQQRGSLGVEEAVQGGHPVHQRGQGQVPAVELLAAVDQRPVRVEDVLQVFTGGAHIGDRPDLRQVGQQLHRRRLLGLRQVPHARLDRPQVLIRQRTVTDLLDRAGEQATGRRAIRTRSAASAPLTRHAPRNHACVDAAPCST